MSICWCLLVFIHTHLYSFQCGCIFLMFRTICTHKHWDEQALANKHLLQHKLELFKENKEAPVYLTFCFIPHLWTMHVFSSYMHSQLPQEGWGPSGLYYHLRKWAAESKVANITCEKFDLLTLPLNLNWQYNLLIYWYFLLWNVIILSKLFYTFDNHIHMLLL